MQREAYSWSDREMNVSIETNPLSTFSIFKSSEVPFSCSSVTRCIIDQRFLCLSSRADFTSRLILYSSAEAKLLSLMMSFAALI